MSVQLRMRGGLAAVLLALVVTQASAAQSAGDAPPPKPLLRAGFAHADITPPWDEKRPIWLAGYMPGRQAASIHDPLFVRCVVLHDGQQKIAFAAVDLIGFQLPDVQKVRERLTDFHHVTIASTHNHEGPDVIGIWGKSVVHRGVDDQYVAEVVERVVTTIRQAEKSLQPMAAFYGTAENESLLRDSRMPVVKDGVLRVVRLNAANSDKPAGLIVQWNCHPEALGASNQELTADFPATTIAALQQTFGCPVVYLSGAVGGLMVPPTDGVHDADGVLLVEGSFDFAATYGNQVADLAKSAVQAAKPITLTPFEISSRPITIPVRNPWYRAARISGVVRRQGRIWTGDFDQVGAPMTFLDAGRISAVATEVSYLRLGKMGVACIPGELYPELVYGHIQEPADPGADYPDAPKEPHVSQIIPEEQWMMIGLANDEIGYIIPRRQWDREPPYCYGRGASQYGELNSCGPDVAPIIMQALSRRVAEANDK